MKSKQTRLYNITFIELMLISFATSLGYSMIATLISSYSVTIGASLTYAGIIAGVFSIAALTLRPFGGFFSDNFNKKYLLVITTVMLAACFLGYSVCHAVVPLILILVLLTAGYAVCGGIESRARVYEILFVVLFVLLAVMLLIAAGDLELEYLYGFF